MDIRLRGVRSDLKATALVAVQLHPRRVARQRAGTHAREAFRKEGSETSGDRVRRSIAAREVATDVTLTSDESIITLSDSTDYDEELVTTTVEEENPYVVPVSRPFMEHAGGEPAVEVLMAEAREIGRDHITVDRLEQIFPFSLDNFQRKAVGHILEDKSVLVSAPTGAGKTAIAEAAAAYIIAGGQRVIYTTPLKALSNQKLYELRKRFGVERCGLQTGDVSLNTEAAVVVMTTEILRNIMYRTAEAVGSSSGSSNSREGRLGDVGLIVLDEVHYLGDADRGSVWEEVIINCPQHIQLLAMSATVKNPEDLGGWMTQEHRPCVTVKTRFRPVPLKWLFGFKDRRGVSLVDLLDSSGRALNPELDTKEMMLAEARRLMEQGQGRMNMQQMDNNPNSRPAWSKVLRALVDKRGPESLHRKIMGRRVPGLEAMITKLLKLDLLPAIWFILSRKDCDLSALKTTMVLTSYEEQRAIQAEVDALRRDQPDALRELYVPALLKGVAVHHAGCLPGWKQLVERLFQRNLLKLVFATGTLAAGINMPARTTIISQLARRTEEGIQLLPHNELLQMAGRAGRRGYDVEGSCIVVQTRFEGADDAWNILHKGPEPLTSQFTTSYGLALNLLSIYSVEEARVFLTRSFGHYLRVEGNARKQLEIIRLEEEARAKLQEYRQSASEDMKALGEQQRVQKQKIKALKAKALRQRCSRAQEMLKPFALPKKVLLNFSKDDTYPPALANALVVAEVAVPQKPGNASAQDNMIAPFYAALGPDNRLMRFSVMHVVGVSNEEAADISPEEVAKILSAYRNVGEKGWANLASGMFSAQTAPSSVSTAQIAIKVVGDEYKEVQADPDLVEKIEKEVLQKKLNKKALSAIQKASQSKLEVRAQRPAAGVLQAKRLMKKAQQLRMELEADEQSTWQTFLDVVDILIREGAMEPGSLRVLPIGQVARSIQGQNELWLALALTHPSVMSLSGPELAAYLGALLSPEVLRRPMGLVALYPASPRVIEAVEQLEEHRERLFQLQSNLGLNKWNDYLLVDLRLAGIVEAWAAGASWQDIMRDIGNLDEGDLARLLIRTTDLLKQIAFQEQLLPFLREAAVQALRGMDRKPVAELMV